MGGRSLNHADNKWFGAAALTDHHMGQHVQASDQDQLHEQAPLLDPDKGDRLDS